MGAGQELKTGDKPPAATSGPFSPGKDFLVLINLMIDAILEVEPLEEKEPAKYTKAWFQWNGRRGGRKYVANSTKAQIKSRATLASHARQVWIAKHTAQ